LSEKAKLLLFFVLLITVGFFVLNVVLFFELKGMVEESAYYKAYAHYLLYSMNPDHRGDQNFIISKQAPKSLAFAFKDPRDQFGNVYVVVREEYLAQRIKQSAKKMVILQFLLIFSLLVLYQLVLEKLWAKVEESREFSKALVQSIAHKLGNFLSVQKTNLSLLRKGFSAEPLRRLQKSVERLERDLSLTLRLSQEETEPVRVWTNLREAIEDILNFFEEELKEKRLILGCKRDVYVLIDQRELEDILYNLLSNAVKYSKSFIHIRTTLGKGKLFLSIRNDFVGDGVKGTGLGLRLLERHIERVDGKLAFRIKRHANLHVCFKSFKV